jgi:hypothetical protein
MRSPELKYQFQYDWSGAEAEFKTAIELNPNVAWIRQAYGWFLMSDGRFDEADLQIEKARQLDPSSLTLSAARGRLYFTRGSTTAPQNIFKTSSRRNLTTRACISLSSPSIRSNSDTQRHLTSFLKFRTLGGTPAERSEELKAVFNNSGWEGVMRRLLQDQENRGSNNQSRRMPTWSYIGLYVQLRDKEKTFYWLERATESRDVATLQLKVEPSYDFIRDDPRYVELLRRIGQKP